MPDPAVRNAVRRLGRGAAFAAKAAPWIGLGAMTGLWVRAARRPTLANPGRTVAETPEQADAREPGHGRQASAPIRIPWLGWRDIVWRTWREVSLDRLPQVAGGITFYSLLALFPAIGAFVSLYGLFADVGAVSGQLRTLAAFVPQGVLSLVGDQMVQLASRPPAGLSVAFLVSLLLSVWSANAGMQSLISGLNVAYGEVEKRRFLVLQSLSYGATFAGLIFVTAVTAVLVAVPLWLIGLGLHETWLLPFRWIVVLGLAIGAFAAVYRYGPSRQKARWRWVIPGAGIAALGWIGGSLGYSWFLNNVAHYDVTYGPLGAVVGFLMWIWVTAMIVLLGAELNAEMEHQTACDTTTGAPAPMGQRGAVMADTLGPAFVGLHKLLDRTEERIGRFRRRGRR